MHILIIILIIGFMIFVHELGHFTFAKLFKVPVSTFAIGFPPTIYSFKKGETTYKLNAVPLGGYVNMSEEGKEDDIDNAVLNKPLYQQIIIMLGGILFNLVSAFLILWIMLMVGVKMPSETGEVVVTSIQPGMPADSPAETTPSDKLNIGDVIVSGYYGNQTSGSVEFKSSQEFVDFVQKSNGKDITLSRIMTYSNSQKSCGGISGCAVVTGPKITPKLVDGNYKLGIGLETVSKQQLSFGKAFVGAGNSLWNILSSTWTALGDLGHKLLRGQKGSLDGVSGPVGLVATGSKMLKTDLIQTMLMLFVVLSANLALLNLLPIPALDGGQVVISIVRKIIPTKYGANVHSIANTIGAVLLFALIAVVTFKDIVGLFK